MELPSGRDVRHHGSIHARSWKGSIYLALLQFERFYVGCRGSKVQQRRKIATFCPVDNPFLASGWLVRSLTVLPAVSSTGGGGEAVREPPPQTAQQWYCQQR